ncbi:MAG: transglycosylase domain-containing protein, partial [Candidatus Dormibacteraceae bacterium]
MPSNWQRLLLLGLSFAALLAGLFFIYAIWTLQELPDPGQRPAFTNTVELFDNAGQKLAQVTNGSQYYQALSGSEMGQSTQQATVAAEDRSYFHHGPIDYFALLRATASDVIHHSATQGASTITQQVVNISINDSRHQKSLSWKLQEAILATGLEQKYSKDQILQMYLNRVFYGHNAYGVGAAAMVFFGKPAGQLDTAQSAFLAGLVRGPSYYDPQTHFERAKERQIYVLNQMVRSGNITQTQADQAAQEQLDLKYIPLNTQTDAPHFVDYVRGWLEQQPNLGPSVLQQGDLKIYTTLDSNLQK